jgi:hypothetical protein
MGESFLIGYVFTRCQPHYGLPATCTGILRHLVCLASKFAKEFIRRFHGRVEIKTAYPFRNPKNLTKLVNSSNKPVPT